MSPVIKFKLAYQELIHVKMILLIFPVPKASTFVLSRCIYSHRYFSFSHLEILKDCKSLIESRSSEFKTLKNKNPIVIHIQK